MIELKNVEKTVAQGPSPTYLLRRIDLARVDRNSAIVRGELELFGIDIDRENIQRAKGAGQLDGRHAQPADADDRG